MFTGIVEELGTIARITDQGDAIRLTVEASTVLEGTGPRRLDLGQRLLPHRRRARRRPLDRRPDAGDARQDVARRRRAGRPGQPRAGGHRRQAARRPHRPGPRRRRRRGHLPLAQRALGRRGDLPAGPPRALPRRQGLHHRRRRQPHGRRGPRRPASPSASSPRPSPGRRSAPAGRATWSTSRPTSSPSTSRSCSPAVSSTASPPHPPPRRTADDPARMADRRHHPRARRCARRPRGDRQPLRPRQRDPRHEALRLGVAGRPRRQRAALHGVRHGRDLGPHRRPAVGPGRSAGLLRRGVGLRLVALVAAEQGGRRVRRWRHRTPVGDEQPSGSSCSSSASSATQRRTSC